MRRRCSYTASHLGAPTSSSSRNCFCFCVALQNALCWGQYAFNRRLERMWMTMKGRRSTGVPGWWSWTADRHHVHIIFFSPALLPSLPPRVFGVLLFALFSSRSLLSPSLPPASIVPRLRNAIDREVFALLFIFVSLEGLGRDLDGPACFRLSYWNTSATLCYALFRTPHPNGRFFSVDPRIGSARKLHLLDSVVLGSRSFSGLNLLHLYELCALRKAPSIFWPQLC
jgi:hypothetical protein